MQLLSLCNTCKQHTITDILITKQLIIIRLLIECFLHFQGGLDDDSIDDGEKEVSSSRDLMVPSPDLDSTVYSEDSSNHSPDQGNPDMVKSSSPFDSEKSGSCTSSISSTSVNVPGSRLEMISLDRNRVPQAADMLRGTTLPAVSKIFRRRRNQFEMDDFNTENNDVLYGRDGFPVDDGLFHVADNLIQESAGILMNKNHDGYDIDNNVVTIDFEPYYGGEKRLIGYNKEVGTAIQKDRTGSPLKNRSIPNPAQKRFIKEETGVTSGLGIRGSESIIKEEVSENYSKNGPAKQEDRTSDDDSGISVDGKNVDPSNAFTSCSNKKTNTVNSSTKKRFGGKINQGSCYGKRKYEESQSTAEFSPEIIATNQTKKVSKKRHSQNEDIDFSSNNKKQYPSSGQTHQNYQVFPFHFSHPFMNEMNGPEKQQQNRSADLTSIGEFRNQYTPQCGVPANEMYANNYTDNTMNSNSFTTTRDGTGYNGSYFYGQNEGFYPRTYNNNNYDPSVNWQNSNNYYQHQPSQAHYQHSSNGQFTYGNEFNINSGNNMLNNNSRSQAFGSCGSVNPTKIYQQSNHYNGLSPYSNNNYPDPQQFQQQNHPYPHSHPSTTINRHPGPEGTFNSGPFTVEESITPSGNQFRQYPPCIPQGCRPQSFHPSHQHQLQQDCTTSQCSNGGNCGSKSELISVGPTSIAAEPQQPLLETQSSIECPYPAMNNTNPNGPTTNNEKGPVLGASTGAGSSLKIDLERSSGGAVVSCANNVNSGARCICSEKGPGSPQQNATSSRKSDRNSSFNQCNSNTCSIKQHQQLCNNRISPVSTASIVQPELPSCSYCGDHLGAEERGDNGGKIGVEANNVTGGLDTEFLACEFPDIPDISETSHS